MVHVLKIYVAPQSEIPDIRRIAVNSDTLNSYQVLVNKITSVIPNLNGKNFELCWKDDDGDDIVITNDDELAQAVANCEDSVIKIYVRFTGIDAEQKNNTTSEVHKGIVCDGCHGDVIGYRYKCLQCEDFDLCHVCNVSGKHSFHDMLKLAFPAQYSRQWLFIGWKRFFQLLFGYEPKNEMIDRFENPPKCPYLANPPKCPYLASPPKCPYLAGQGRPLPKMDAPPLKELLKTHPNLLENIEQFIGNSQSSSVVDLTVDTDHSMKESNSTESEEEKKEIQKVPESPEDSVAKSVESEEQKLEITTTESELPDKIMSTTTESVNVTEGTNPSANVSNPKSDEETKPKSTCEFLNESVVTDATTDGFTIITASSYNGTDAKSETVVQPSAPEADEKVQHPVLGEEPVQMNEEPISDGKQTPLFYRYSDIDPQILNALNRMAAMGFSNEGGWLLRLLQMKKGNINEALDALYPNPQRH